MSGADRDKINEDNERSALRRRLEEATSKMGELVAKSYDPGFKLEDLVASMAELRVVCGCPNMAGERCGSPSGHDGKHDWEVAPEPARWECTACRDDPSALTPCPCAHAPCIHDRNAEVARLKAELAELREELRHEAIERDLNT